MGEINLLDLYPKANRSLDTRAQASPEDRKVAQLFGKEYFDGTRNQGYGGYRYDGRWKPVVNRFQGHYDLTSQSKILDVGSAKGFMLHDFKELIPEVTVAGVDISPYAVDNTMDDIKPFVQVGNAKKLPFPEKSFDLIISINTIHNLPLEEAKQALREMERVGRRHKFLTVDAYHNEEEKTRLLKWNLTAKTYMSCDEWVALFKEVDYTGDYYWFIP